MGIGLPILTPRSPERKENIKQDFEMSRTVCRPQSSQTVSKQDPEEASVHPKPKSSTENPFEPGNKGTVCETSRSK